MPRRARILLTGLAAGTLAIAALTACGSSGGSDASGGTPTAPASPTSTSSSASTATSTAAPAGTKVIDVTLTGSKVSPAPDTIEVKKGTPVQITVTRDSAGEVHVHGYDLEQDATPGEPVTFNFVADQQGVFEVEAHDPDLLLFKLQVN